MCSTHRKLNQRVKFEYNNKMFCFFVPKMSALFTIFANHVYILYVGRILTGFVGGGLAVG